MADDSVEIEGYDGAVDEGPSFGGSSFGGSHGRAGIPSPGRRGGKKALAPPSSSHYGKHGRSMSRRSVLPGFSFDPRQIAGSVSSMLIVVVIGVVIVAAILYYTFLSGSVEASQQFYGALVAAMAVTLLISYVAVKLLGSAE